MPATRLGPGSSETIKPVFLFKTLTCVSPYLLTRIFNSRDKSVPIDVSKRPSKPESNRKGHSPKPVQSISRITSSTDRQVLLDESSFKILSNQRQASRSCCWYFASSRTSLASSALKAWGAASIFTLNRLTTWRAFATCASTPTGDAPCARQKDTATMILRTESVFSSKPWFMRRVECKTGQRHFLTRLWGSNRYILEPAKVFFNLLAALLKLDDGWPESEKDVFQAALRMVVVKDSRWMAGEFLWAMEG